MQKAKCPRQLSWRNVVFILVGIIITLADQLSKAWIRSNVAYGGSLIELGVFRITHIHNTGAGFGLFPGQSSILSVIALAGIVVVFFCVFFSHRYLPFLDNMLGKFTFGLVLGGIVGNLIDRLRFGYVTDFLDFTYWPTFNIADSAETISIILFAYLIIRQSIVEKG